MKSTLKTNTKKCKQTQKNITFLWEVGDFVSYFPDFFLLSNKRRIFHWHVDQSVHAEKDFDEFRTFSSSRFQVSLVGIFLFEMFLVFSSLGQSDRDNVYDGASLRIIVLATKL